MLIIIKNDQLILHAGAHAKEITVHGVYSKHLNSVRNI